MTEETKRQIIEDAKAHNPFLKKSFNLTRQIALDEADPELAERLLHDANLAEGRLR